MPLTPRGLPACLLPLLLAAPGLAGAQGDTFEETVALEPGGSLSIEATGGSVLLLAWDRPQVEIQARIEAPADVPESLPAGRLFAEGHGNTHRGSVRAYRAVTD